MISILSAFAGLAGSSVFLAFVKLTKAKPTMGSLALSVVRSLVILALVCGAVAASPPQAVSPRQLAVPESRAFTSQTAMNRLIPSLRGDLRSSFYLILQARRLKLAEYAALEYRALWLASPHDPKLEAEFAFAHMAGIAVLSYDSPTTTQKALRSKLREFICLSQADECRKNSLLALPGSPEVHLMAAMNAEQSARFSESLDENKQALRLAPDWGYAHKRMASILNNLSNQESDTRKKNENAKLALSELALAVQLDPMINTPDMQFLYVHPYTQLKDYAKAIHCIDLLLGSNEGIVEPERSGLLKSRVWLVGLQSQPQ